MALITIPRNLKSKLRLRTIITRLARKHRLFFSHLVKIAGHLLAIDDRKGRLLLVKKRLGITDCLIIDFKDLRSCSVIREYHPIKAGGLQTRPLSDYLKSIILCFRFMQHRHTLLLPVFESSRPGLSGSDYEKKAARWQKLIERSAGRVRLQGA